MSLAGARPVHTWITDPEGSACALLQVRERLLRPDDAQYVVLYFSPSVGAIGDLEDWCALKNLNLSRLLLHFTIRDEPQELAVNSGALEAAKLRDLTTAFCGGTENGEFHLSVQRAGMPGAQALLRGLGVPDAAAAYARKPEHTAVNADLIGSSADTLRPEVSAEGHCQVTVIADGRTRHFAAADDETVLEAGERAGLALPFSCRSAVCSTCRTRVISGAVEMAQNYALEEWELEAGFILACQSRPTTPELTITYDEK